MRLHGDFEEEEKTGGGWNKRRTETPETFFFMEQVWKASRGYFDGESVTTSRCTDEKSPEGKAKRQGKKVKKLRVRKRIVIQDGIRRNTGLRERS